MWNVFSEDGLPRSTFARGPRGKGQGARSGPGIKQNAKMKRGMKGTAEQIGHYLQHEAPRHGAKVRETGAAGRERRAVPPAERRSLISRVIPSPRSLITEPVSREERRHRTTDGASGGVLMSVLTAACTLALHKHANATWWPTCGPSVRCCLGQPSTAPLKALPSSSAAAGIQEITATLEKEHVGSNARPRATAPCARTLMLSWSCRPEMGKRAYWILEDKSVPTDGRVVYEKVFGVQFKGKWEDDPVKPPSSSSAPAERRRDQD
ncbi:unnamed protein product [Gadus morhua 'NCC']